MYSLGEVFLFTNDSLRSHFTPPLGTKSLSVDDKAKSRFFLILEHLCKIKEKMQNRLFPLPYVAASLRTCNLKSLSSFVKLHLIKFLELA